MEERNPANGCRVQLWQIQSRGSEAHKAGGFRTVVCQRGISELGAVTATSGAGASVRSGGNWLAHGACGGLGYDEHDEPQQKSACRGPACRPTVHRLLRSVAVYALADYPANGL